MDPSECPDLYAKIELSPTPHDDHPIDYPPAFHIHPGESRSPFSVSNPHRIGRILLLKAVFLPAHTFALTINAQKEYQLLQISEEGTPGNLGYPPGKATFYHYTQLSNRFLKLRVARFFPEGVVPNEGSQTG